MELRHLRCFGRGTALCACGEVHVASEKMDASTVKAPSQKCLGTAREIIQQPR